MPASEVPCTVPSCSRTFKNQSGLTKHVRVKHPLYRVAQPSPEDEHLVQVPSGSAVSSPLDGQNTPAASFVGADLPTNQEQAAPVSLASSPRQPSPAASPYLDSPSSSPAQPEPPQPSNHQTAHERQVPNRPSVTKFTHPFLDGKPCNEHGEYLAPGTPPPPRYPNNNSEDWSPYGSRVEFELAGLLYSKSQMSAADNNWLMQLWSMTLEKYNDLAPYANHKEMLDTIDATPFGGVPWQTFEIRYSGPVPENRPSPHWMSGVHKVFFRDPRLVIREMLANPDYEGSVDYAPLRVFNQEGERQYEDLMTGNWAWAEADKISADESTRGAMLVPIILGSDKTTVSVATGFNEYWPLYISIGTVHNSIRRTHRGALIPVAFLPIPKGSKTDAQDVDFRNFRCQVFHSSLSQILQPLRPGMTEPEVVRCPDNHFQRAIYSLGPYIGDYPEQVLLSCIVQGWCPRCTSPKKDELEPDAASISRTREHTEELRERLDTNDLWFGYGLVGTATPFTNDFPRADIHELLSPDLLHQLIKGTFKDHLVTWVTEYIEGHHSESRAREILDEIDYRISLAPPFAGLRRFPEGRGFKQWTGDDSKALMKVYLSAIECFVPRNVIRAIQAFLEFCYIARRNVITESSLELLEQANTRFQRYRMVFKDLGVRADGFGLPRQHSMVHYAELIRLFGAPNGLCSSITEAKHIKAVKEPWRRSNRHNPLDQMLWSNQRLDKLAAARVEFTHCGMLSKDDLARSLKRIEELRRTQGAPTRKRGKRHEIEDLDSIVNDPNVWAHVELARKPRWRKPVHAAAAKIHAPQFPALIRRFLYDQLYPSTHWTSADISLAACPAFEGMISAFTSATSIFFAPSDPSGTKGMRREPIRAAPRWRNGPARYDCVFVSNGSRSASLQSRGLRVARVRLFFSFSHQGVAYPCALVHWYSVLHDQPDSDTGMWMVAPDLENDEPKLGVVHIGAILRAAHLLPVFDDAPLPSEISFSDSLNLFRTFYVNKFADHHSFEFAS